MLQQIFDYKSPHFFRRLFVMVFGIFIMGIGVCLFKLSLTGNDPSSAFVLAICGKIGVPFSLMLLPFNAACFVVEVITARHLIGLGTLFNWACVGMFTDLWTKILTHFIEFPSDFAGRIIVMAIGVAILSLSAALYQTANLGIAPYDALSISLNQHKPKIPYFWCRIFTDSICALFAFLLGGIVGLGTLVCALGLGPIITFFTKTVAEPMCGTRSKK